MNRATQRDAASNGTNWVAASAAALLLVSAGLELLAHQFFGQTSMATLLLAVYLGFWSFVLGIIFVFVLALRGLLAWWRLRAAGETVHRDSVSGPGTRSFVEPGQQAARLVAPDAVLIGPCSRAATGSNDDIPSWLPKAG